MKDKQQMRFQVMVGRHEGDDGHIYDARDEKNNIVTTHIDLAERFGPKFRRIHEDRVVEKIVTVDDLGRMSEASLRAIAKEENIDLKGAKTKQEIVKVLRAGMAAMAAG